MISIARLFHYILYYSKYLQKKSMNYIIFDCQEYIYVYIFRIPLMQVF